MSSFLYARGRSFELSLSPGAPIKNYPEFCPEKMVRLGIDSYINHSKFEAFGAKSSCGFERNCHWQLNVYRSGMIDEYKSHWP